MDTGVDTHGYCYVDTLRIMHVTCGCFDHMRIHGVMCTRVSMIHSVHVYPRKRVDACTRVGTVTPSWPIPKFESAYVSIHVYSRSMYTHVHAMDTHVYRYTEMSCTCVYTLHVFACIQTINMRGTREYTVRAHAYTCTVYMRVHDEWIRVCTVTCICRVHTYSCCTNTCGHCYVYVLRTFVSRQHEYVWTRACIKQCT
jgi:hypothetical protein